MESQNRAFSLYFIGPHSFYIFHNADASLVKTNCNLIFMGHFRIFYLVYLPQKSKIANRWKLNCMRKTLCIYTLSLMFLFMMILDHLYFDRVLQLQILFSIFGTYLCALHVFIYIGTYSWNLLRFFWQVDFFLFYVFLLLKNSAFKAEIRCPIAKKNNQKSKKWLILCSNKLTIHQKISPAATYNTSD